MSKQEIKQTPDLLQYYSLMNKCPIEYKIDLSKKYYEKIKKKI